MPRPLGTCAVEWQPTDWQDEVLSRMGVRSTVR